jgi:segregation and condensation protein A
LATTPAKNAVPMERLWSENEESRGVSEPSLVVDVDGFEGPLDLLLALARTQKVDLSRISVLALVEQYIAFIEQARRMRLELAADYLVMAAWLAYLKSKLLIPKQPGDQGESGEELAAVLQFRLKRLEAMRDAAARLVNRNRLGRDVFARGMPETVIVEKHNEYTPRPSTIC